MIRQLFNRKPPIVYYLSPDYDNPSWGIGLLYSHVRLLRKNGIDAAIVHHHAPFRLSWLPSDVPITYLDAPDFKPRRRDVLVVPEVAAGRKSIRRIHCRRFVFVQGSFLILTKLEQAVGYKKLGYEGGLTIMPHVQDILRQHYDLDAPIIPPYIAPYFFLGASDMEKKPRARQIVLYPKAGVEDYDILLKLLGRYLATCPDWTLVELKGKSHREVAEIMQNAAFSVCLNCREAFNTTVPEAMAAGCIPVCYEGYGGRDFLRDGVNAYVFPNNYIYPLANRLFGLIDGYDSLQEELGRVRANAYTTACQYTESSTEQALIAFYKPLLS